MDEARQQEMSRLGAPCHLLGAVGPTSIGQVARQDVQPRGEVRRAGKRRDGNWCQVQDPSEDVHPVDAGLVGKGAPAALAKVWESRGAARAAITLRPRRASARG